MYQTKYNMPKFKFIRIPFFWLSEKENELNNLGIKSDTESRELGYSNVNTDYIQSVGQYDDDICHIIMQDGSFYKTPMHESEVMKLVNE